MSTQIVYRCDHCDTVVGPEEEYRDGVVSLKDGQVAFYLCRKCQSVLTVLQAKDILRERVRREYLAHLIPE